MPRCDCATDYEFLVGSLESLIEDVANFDAENALATVDHAREAIRETERSCGVDLGPARARMPDVVGSTADLFLRLVEAVAAEQPSGPRLAQEMAIATTGIRPELVAVPKRGVELSRDLLRSSDEAKRSAQDALRAAEDVLAACTSEACGCATSLLAFHAVDDGLVRAAEAANPDDLTATSLALQGAAEASAKACGIPRPPGSVFEDLAARVADLRGAIPGATPFLPTTEKLLEEGRRIALGPPLPKEPPGAVRERKLREEAERAVEEAIGAETPEERIVRLENVARLRAIAQRFQRQAVAGSQATFGQELPPAGFEEILRSFGVPVAAETGRSILDVIDDPEFLDAAEKAGFTIDQLAGLTYQQYRNVVLAKEAGRITADRLREMSLDEARAFADTNAEPRPPAEGWQRRFEEQLRRRGLRLTTEPGKIIARPRPLGVREAFPAEIKRGPPRLKIEKIPGPPVIEPACPEAWEKFAVSDGEFQLEFQGRDGPELLAELVGCETEALDAGDVPAVACADVQRRVSDLYDALKPLDAARDAAERDLAKCLGPAAAKERGIPGGPRLEAFPGVPEAELRRYETSKSRLMDSRYAIRSYVDAAVSECRRTEELPTLLELIGVGP